jgi:uncharacterized Ntn-hydrolase superfamily protein
VSNSVGQHTFSIVAVDTATGQIGAAGATCLDSSGSVPQGARIISDLIPGVGAINAQASVCIPNFNLQQGIVFLGQGHSALAMIDSMTFNDVCSFGDSNNRQYGVALIDSFGNPQSAGFTGASALSVAEHIVGPGFSAQGNILLNDGVVDSIAAGFMNTAGPLCDKLMAALQGANIAGADSRCMVPDSVSSLSAFIRVANPTDSPGNFYMDLYVHSLIDGYDPIDALQVTLDIFKTGDCSTVQADFDENTLTLELGQPLMVTDASTNVLYRQWDMGDGGVFTDNRTTINYGYSVGDYTVRLIGSSYTCQDTIEKTVSVRWPAGMENKYAGVPVSVQPNPATDQVKIFLDQEYQPITWTVNNIAGQSFEIQPYVLGEGVYVADVSHLPNGIYVLAFSSDHFQGITRMTIIHE